MFKCSCKQRTLCLVPDWSTSVALPPVLALNALPALLCGKCHSGHAQYILARLICDSWPVVREVVFEVEPSILSKLYLII